MKTVTVIYDYWNRYSRRHVCNGSLQLYQISKRDYDRIQKLEHTESYGGVNVLGRGGIQEILEKYKPLMRVDHII